MRRGRQTFKRPGRVPGSQTPSQSPNPSQIPWDDGITSIASTTSPTFAPLGKDQQGTSDVDLRGPWPDSHSGASTSEGPETLEVLELDVKSQNEEEDGTYRLNDEEHGAVPSSMFTSFSSSVLMFCGFRDIPPGIYSKLYTPCPATTSCPTVRSRIFDAITLFILQLPSGWSPSSRYSLLWLLSPTSSHTPRARDHLPQ
jgi:hypothetical protein